MTMTMSEARVVLDLTDDQLRPARALADTEHGGDLSAAVRRIVAEWAAHPGKIASLERERDAWRRVVESRLDNYE